MLRPAKRAASAPAPRIFDQTDVGGSSDAAKARLEVLRARYAGADALTLLRGAIKTEFPGRITTVSSFGSESVVLLHLIAQIDPSVPVIFLNTGKLFGETLRYRDRLQDRLGLTDIRAIRPHPDDEKALDADGTLWSRDTNACCNFRKVLPLRRAIAGFEAEITGRKRFQTAARTGMSPIELNGPRFVINPLWDWSLVDLKNHILTHDLPRHPLVEDGFLSIGCMPCTQRVKDGDDYRSGRWAGSDKDECGIHENVEGDGI
ncbi:MAG: phosphoadenylyl-sulfate reductase [Alphaproteobacteria bacterium]|nr:phosphoadenylyl-sulfate reductase [Alphaproteobacteria bacterium]